MVFTSRITTVFGILVFSQRSVIAVTPAVVYLPRYPGCSRRSCHHGMCSTISCLDDSDCTGDRRCDTDLSKCLPSGHNCEIDADCGPDLICEDGGCYEAPKVGDKVRSGTSLLGLVAIVGLTAGLITMIYRDKNKA